MIDHCAYCLHRANAPDGPDCSYEVEGYEFRKEKRPCREMTEYGATYRCFKLDREMQVLDWNEESARLEALCDTILGAIDKLEWRIANIEEGLQIAARRR
jgi:hypothetical protein